VPRELSKHAEDQHRAKQGNALRAAVLGANDGLVSNLSLVMGVAGASLGRQEILITGLAGLIAGSCSMAMGEWVSVTSARELMQRELAVERRELEESPDEERDELIAIYESKGLSETQAASVAEGLMANPAAALDTHAREELGIDPDDLGGSPWQAAGASFLLFCVGAIPPIIPYVFVGGTTAIVISLVLSGIALFAIGALITRLTDRSPLKSGARQLAIGFAAAAVTYGVGAVIGTAV
jgi:VIT1/CCC1 family predicted Fe2+/Mn2+ transporter